MAQTGKLGTVDSRLGNMQLAFAGAEDPQPSTGIQTGKLGTVASLLGNMRPALGEAEGSESGGIINATADSTLSLSSEAVLASHVHACIAESSLSLDAAAEFMAVFVVAADSALSLGSEAGRNNLPNLVAESALVLDELAEVNKAWAVEASNTLALTVEAESGVLEAIAENTIGLTQEAARNNILSAVAESVVSIVSEAGRNNLPNLSAESILSLATTAQSSILAVSAESILALTDTAGRNNLLSATADSTLALGGSADASRSVAVGAESVLSGLDSVATVAVARAVSAQSVISLVQTEHVARPWYVAAQSAIALTQVEHTARPWYASGQSAIALVQVEQTSRPWYLSAETPLQTYTEQYDPETDTFYPVYEGLQDSASVARPVSVAIQQVIPLQQLATVVRIKATAINVSAESVLELLGEVSPNQTGDAGHWLLLSQTAAVDKCKPATSELVLTSEAAVWVSVLRGAASALALSQAATYSIVSGCVLQQYTPFVGEGASGSPTPPPTVLESPDYVGLPFKLFYPAEGSITDYVTLRAPNLGNKDRLSFNRILRETRGGTLIVFADPIWPKIQTLVLTFSGLRSVQTQQLLTFLDTHLGEEIGLLDWEGRAWKGIVTSPTEPVVQDGKDSFSASLEFEGELVPA